MVTLHNSADFKEKKTKTCKNRKVKEYQRRTKRIKNMKILISTNLKSSMLILVSQFSPYMTAPTHRDVRTKFSHLKSVSRSLVNLLQPRKTVYNVYQVFLLILSTNYFRPPFVSKFTEIITAKYLLANIS